jgi:two-component SAPR family response regulator
MRDIDELRERLEILEETNRQLKDEIGLIDEIPNMQKLRVLGLSMTGFRLMVLLQKRKMVLKSTIIMSLWPNGDEPETAMNVMSIQLYRVRKCLRQYGIEIKNTFNVGWYIEGSDREKMGDVVAEMMK